LERTYQTCARKTDCQEVSSGGDGGGRQGEAEKEERVPAMMRRKRSVGGLRNRDAKNDGG